MIDVTAIQKFLSDDMTPHEFAEQLHRIMADYVRLACFAGANADLSVVGNHIEILEEFRNSVLLCKTLSE